MVAEVQIDGRRTPSHACASCATLPPSARPAGTFTVAAPTVEHRLLVAACLEGLGAAPTHLPGGRLRCELPPDALAEVAAALAVELPAEVLDGSRAALGTDDADLASTGARTLRATLRDVERAWLIDVLGHGRLETNLQPIVDVAAATPFAHECLTRGRTPGGELVSPGRLFGAADRAALLFHLDRSARLASIENAARRDPAGRYFVNFTPTSVYNPAYCLRSTVEMVERVGIDAGRVTFEVIESVRVQDVPHLDKIFAVYRQRGFTVALDDVTSSPAAAELMAVLQPDFVKIDRSLVDRVDLLAEKQKGVVEILDQCRRLGIEPIVEGVERPEERDWLAAAGARLMQGYLFGRPTPA